MYLKSFMQTDTILSDVDPPDESNASPSHIFCCVSGDGCGHTVQGAESGTLASQNYPGTYPSNTWCRWRLRVPEGRTLRLLFGDFDVESSPGCSNGSIVITDKSGELSLGESLHCACKSHL